jgi:hypothetical protein
MRNVSERVVTVLISVRFVPDFAPVIPNTLMRFAPYVLNVVRLVQPNAANMTTLAARLAPKLARNVRKPARCSRLETSLRSAYNWKVCGGGFYFLTIKFQHYELTTKSRSIPDIHCHIRSLPIL